MKATCAVLPSAESRYRGNQTAKALRLVSPNSFFVGRLRSQVLTTLSATACFALACFVRATGNAATNAPAANLEVTTTGGVAEGVTSSKAPLAKRSTKQLR
jgi:hypothetical protein